jgi:hypothetical protein
MGTDMDDDGQWWAEVGAREQYEYEHEEYNDEQE